MYETFKTFQKVAELTDNLLAGRLSHVDSTEIQQSAKALQQSIKPGLEEMRRFAFESQTHLQNCLQVLDDADDVLYSKQRLQAVSEYEILEQIGLVTGCWSRIQQLGVQFKADIYQQCQESWSQKLEVLKKEYFWDPKKDESKLNVGLGRKQDFIQKIWIETSEINRILEKHLKESINIFLINLDCKDSGGDRDEGRHRLSIWISAR